MNLTNLLIFLAIGAVAGWLAGQLLKGSGYGLLGTSSSASSDRSSTVIIGLTSPER